MATSPKQNPSADKASGHTCCSHTPAKTSSIDVKPSVEHDHAGHEHGHDHEHDHGDSHSHSHDHSHDHSHSGHDACSGASSTPLPSDMPSAEDATGGVRTVVRILQMDCPTEETLIRGALGRLPAVQGLSFNLMQRTLDIRHDPKALDTIMTAIRGLGYEPELQEGAPTPLPAAKMRWTSLIVAAVAAGASEVVHWMSWPEWASATLAVLAIAICGLTTYKKGWVAIRNGNLNINALMSIAVTGALALGQWPEAAMVMVLFTLAESIEAQSLDRARNAIAGLMQLAPDLVMVRQDDGRWQSMPVAEVGVGSFAQVKPGERIGLDGVVVEGRSTVDQAPITGESMPVDKSIDDPVYAGTINGSGTLQYRVTAAASQTTLARIINAIEQAQGARAPTQRFVDRFARIYTPLVLVMAVGVAVFAPLFLGAAWQPWIYKALVLLVIACPCALVISTPVTVVSGLAAAARRGILIKGGAYLEAGRKLTWIALDKTGTLTEGKPVQTDFESYGDSNARAIGASLANASDHPVSQAIARKAASDALTVLPVANLQAIPGQGVRGQVDAQEYWLGNLRLARALGHGQDSVAMQRLADLEGQGKTVVMLMSQQAVLALFAVADTVKQTSLEAVTQLHALGVKTLMLTGDNEHTAATIAAQVGIDAFHGNQLPEDKLRAVEALTAQGTVGMVGDGINDAPALARADIGFAMGAMGTDTAIETADVALMDDDLRKIPAFIRLSRATRRILVQNIVLALGIKAVFLVLTMAGSGTMWMAVFADVGASLLVVANGLRLLRH